jgi:hypothetical protein
VWRRPAQGELFFSTAAPPVVEAADWQRITRGGRGGGGETEGEKSRGAERVAEAEREMREG